MSYQAGPTNPGSIASLGGGGDTHGSNGYTYGGQWSTPLSNGLKSDGLTINANGGLTGISSDILQHSNFGFNLPPTAVIKGIMVEYQITSLSGANALSIGLNKGTYKNNTSAIVGQWYQFGGATDLWGASWTPSDINSSSFASTFQTTSQTSSGFNITMDGARITVWWDYAPTPIGTVQKQYLYQVYRQGVYLGQLPNVTSDFTYNQNINTAGVQINITCAVSVDTSGLDAPILETEDGQPLQTEAGDTLTTERYPDIIGNTNSGAVFRNGNQLIIWEISDYHPNGQQVFSGDIESWEAQFGGSEGDVVKLAAYSDGADLNNFIMTGGDTLDQSQTSQNGTLNVSVFGGGKGSGWNDYGQTFVIGAGITNLEAISIFSQGGGNVTVSVYSSVAAAGAGTSGTPLAQVTQYLPYTGTATEYKFVFAPILNVTAGQSLFFAVSTPDNTTGIPIYYQNTDVYGSGSLQNSSYAGGSGGGGWGAMTGDLMFKTYYGGNTTTFTYSSMDPTNMLIDAVNRYNAKGGSIRVASGSTDLTGRSLSYPFKVATVLTGIQKFQDLAPYDWFWYVDIGSDTLFFKEMATTPKWYLTKGRHIAGLGLKASTENVKNLLLFTGGNTGTTNLFSQYSDQVSIQNNKQRLAIQADNRVTVQGTADALGNSFVKSNKDEVYNTTVTITDTTMDISAFKLGDTVGFTGFGNFIDQLCLQIVAINYSPSEVVLTLGQLPPRTNETLKDIQRQLDDLNTLNNPSSPS